MLHSIPEPVDPVGNAPFLNLQHSCYVSGLDHFWLVGAAGFEPATTRTPSEKEEES
jgi:hypothetical protein